MNIKYENEIKVIDKYFRYLYTKDNILNQVRSFRILHGGGHRYESYGKEEVSLLKGLTTEISYTYEDVINFDLELFCQKLYEMVKTRLEQIKTMMYAEIINSTELTGNKIDAKGSSLNPDMLLDILEKIEIRFNDDDEPIMPQLHVAPQQFLKLKNMKYTLEQEKRYQDIINSKREKWHAKKRYRRLSYIN